MAAAQLVIYITRTIRSICTYIERFGKLVGLGAGHTEMVAHCWSDDDWLHHPRQYEDCAGFSL